MVKVDFEVLRIYNVHVRISTPAYLIGRVSLIKKKKKSMATHVSCSLSYMCAHTFCLDVHITSGGSVEISPPSSEQYYLLKLVLFQLVIYTFIPCKCNTVPQDGTDNLL